MSILKVDIRGHQGKPCMFRQDRPDFSLWLWQLAIQAEDAQAFGRAGVDVFTFCGPSWYVYPGWVGPDKYDYREFDQIMQQFIEAAPAEPDDEVVKKPGCSVSGGGPSGVLLLVLVAGLLRRRRG